MRPDPDARLLVATPCSEHGRYMAHGDCKGPPFTILLEYTNPLAEVDCEGVIVPISVEAVIHAAYVALDEDSELAR